MELDEKQTPLNSNKIVLYAIDAGAGDCILLHLLDSGLKVLIDSGPSRGEGRLKVRKALSEILVGDNIIDLAIVTHNDDDHIGGFADLIKNEVIVVDTFLFNDSSYIGKLFPATDAKLSLKQDRGLQGAMHARRVNQVNLHNNSEDNNLKKFHFKGLEFTLLSPDEKKLKKYGDYINRRDEMGDKNTKFSAPTELASLEGFTNLINEVRKKDIFIEDSSISNGTSLAFNLAMGTKNFLFLGDAHPSLIANRIQYLENNNFDLCKLSHHGSQSNTSQELLSKIKCNYFLICGDGKNHDHPSLVTIARVLISNPESKFYFSSDSDEIRRKTDSIGIQADLALSGYLKVEYENT